MVMPPNEGGRQMARPHRKWSYRLSRALALLVTLFIVVVVFWLQIPWHEVVGHGLMGVVCGGKVTYMQVFGVQIVPTFGWTGIGEGFTNVGDIDFSGLGPSTCYHLMTLAGSLSTWMVAMVSVTLLWIRRWRGWRRAVLATLSVWCLDLLTFTLPSFGIRRGVFIGTTESEPYEAAVALGIPGALFQAVVVSTSALVLVMLTLRLVQDGLISWREARKADR